MEKTSLNITPSCGYICSASVVRYANNPTDAKRQADGLIAENVFGIRISSTSKANSSVDL
jgi:hypothetical protein